MAGPEELPAAIQKGPTLYSGSLAEPHLFILPPNTAGEAKLKGRSQPQAISKAPPSHQGLPVIAPSYSDRRKCAVLYSAWYLTGDVLQPPITFSYATISSDTDIQSSCSLLHSAIQKEKTGEGAHWNCHKKICEEDRRHSL
ncbi:hypothetical protein ABG768_003407 [Culter alburnus]